MRRPRRLLVLGELAAAAPLERAGPARARPLRARSSSAATTATVASKSRSIPVSNSSGTSTTASVGVRRRARSRQRGDPLADERVQQPTRASAAPRGRSKTIAPTRARSTSPPGATSAPQRSTSRSRHARLAEQLVDDRVGGERRGAEALERRERLGLAGGDRAGEPDEGHGRRGRHRAGVRRLGSLGGVVGGSASAAGSSAAGLGGAAPRRRPAPRRRASSARPALARRAASSAAGSGVGGLGGRRPRPRRRASEKTSSERPRSGTSLGRRPRRGCCVGCSSAGSGRGAAVLPVSRALDARARSGGAPRRSRGSAPRPPRRAVTTSPGVSTWCSASSEMWTRPSTPGTISTKAPKATTLVTLPSRTSPGGTR